MSTNAAVSLTISELFLGQPHTEAILEATEKGSVEYRKVISKESDEDEFFDAYEDLGDEDEASCDLKKEAQVLSPQSSVSDDEFFEDSHDYLDPSEGKEFESLEPALPSSSALASQDISSPTGEPLEPLSPYPEDTHNLQSQVVEQEPSMSDSVVESAGPLPPIDPESVAAASQPPVVEPHDQELHLNVSDTLIESAEPAPQSPVDIASQDLQLDPHDQEPQPDTIDQSAEPVHHSPDVASQDPVVEPHDQEPLSDTVNESAEPAPHRADVTSEDLQPPAHDQEPNLNSVAELDEFAPSSSHEIAPASQVLQLSKLECFDAKRPLKVSPLFRRLHGCIQAAASRLKDSSTKRSTKRVEILVHLIPKELPSEPGLASYFIYIRVL